MPTDFAYNFYMMLQAGCLIAQNPSLYIPVFEYVCLTGVVKHRSVHLRSHKIVPGCLVRALHCLSVALYLHLMLSFSLLFL